LFCQNGDAVARLERSDSRDRHPHFAALNAGYTTAVLRYGCGARVFNHIEIIDISGLVLRA
jgi:hypothetical protein